MPSSLPNAGTWESPNSAYTINKTLFYMRKNNLLKRLNSIKTSFNYDSYAFASEFAANRIEVRNRGDD